MDEDDDILLSTQFSFKRAAANSVLTSESEEEPTVNLKDLLGNERDALLASESFWDRFTQPTKEEELLREEKERLFREASDEEEEEAEEDLTHHVRIINGRDDLFNEVTGLEEVCNEHLPRRVGIRHPIEFENLFRSNFGADLLVLGKTPDRTLDSNSWINSCRLVGSLYNNQFQAMEKFILGCMIEENSTTSFSVKELISILQRAGIDLREAVEAPGPRDEKIAYEATHCLKALLGILRKYILMHPSRECEESIASIFKVFLPLLFVREFDTVALQLEQLILASVEWIPVFSLELIRPWLEASKDFLTKPLGRLYVLLDLLAGSSRAACSIIEIVDFFWADVVGLQCGEEGRDAFFLRTLNEIIGRFSSDPSYAGMKTLRTVLHLASYRLFNMSIEDLSKEDLERLKLCLTKTKDLISPQPSMLTITTLDLLSKLSVHLEVYLRSLGAPNGSILRNSLITDKFKPVPTPKKAIM